MMISSPHLFLLITFKPQDVDLRGIAQDLLQSRVDKNVNIQYWNKEVNITWFSYQVHFGFSSAQMVGIILPLQFKY